MKSKVPEYEPEQKNRGYSNTKYGEGDSKLKYDQFWYNQNVKPEADCSIEDSIKSIKQAVKRKLKNDNKIK